MSRYAPKPPECLGCPAAALGFGYVPGTGPLTSRIALVGQGPGEDEASAREPQPFIGRSGQRLNTWLGEAGIPRSETWIDNVVSCYLVRRTTTGRPKLTKTGRMVDREPTAREQAECWKRHVGAALHALPNLRVVVPIGMPAARFLMQRKITTGLAGTIEFGSLPTLEV